MSQREIDPAAVRQQLGRIVQSAELRNSIRLKKFLTFVVEAAVDGRSAFIKAYTVAIEALGRSADFDPQSDAIVRVEAGRLRRALAHYYDGPGVKDPLIIDLPRGTYVPSFRWVPSGAVAQTNPSAEFPVAAARSAQFRPAVEETMVAGERMLSQLTELFQALSTVERTLLESRILLQRAITFTGE